MLATYSGTKAFLETFTSALAEEVRSHGVVVQNLNTYFVVRNIYSVPEQLHLTMFSLSFPGIQNVQYSTHICVNTQSCILRARVPLQNWLLMRRSFHWAPRHAHSVLEPRAPRLRNARRRREDSVYRLYPFAAQGYQEKGTQEAGEGGQERVDSLIRFIHSVSTLSWIIQVFII